MNYTLYTTFHTMVEEKGIEATAEYACSFGFSSVELFSMAKGRCAAVPDVKAAKEMRRVLDSYGLSMACSSVFYDAESETLDDIREKIEIAAVLGAPYLHHTLLPEAPKEGTHEEFLRRIAVAVDAAELIAREAKKYGICCIYEDQGRAVNGVEGFGAFFRKIKERADNVGVCADLGNILYVNEPPQPFLRAFAEDIKHVHIKDYLARPATEGAAPGWRLTKDGSYLKDTLVGQGIIDLKECLSIIKASGYTGAYALELCHEESIDLGIRTAMDTVDRIMATL